MSSERVVGRFWKSVGRRMMSEGGEYSDGCEYELLVKRLCIKIFVGKCVSVGRSIIPGWSNPLPGAKRCSALCFCSQNFYDIEIMCISVEVTKGKKLQ
jgi:hypothetical protein